MIAASAGEDESTRDAAGFVALVEPVLPAAYRLAVAMLRSTSEAEDAVQEAAFKAWRHFAKFRSGSDMKPWLLAIVANECRRQRRNRWSQVIRTDEQIESETRVLSDHSELRRAIYRLPHDQRLAIALRYYLDLSFDEAAAVMKTSTKAAKSRTYRALERLRLSPEVLADE